MKDDAQSARPSMPQCLGCAIALAALWALLFAEVRAQPDALRYRPGLRNSPGPRRLNPRQLAALLRSLREKTGFQEMAFEENGFLTLGDRTRIAGGSEFARRLLVAAVEMAQAVDLETANDSMEVAFARLGNQLVFHNRTTNAHIETSSIQIDFMDFGHLRGDKRALAAFDLGFVILHELGHAVLGLRDSYDESEGPGQCEDYINRIRRELHLPERQTYLAYARMMAPSPGLSLPHAELRFSFAGDAQSKSLSVLWEADRVGLMRSLATLRRGDAAKGVSASAP